MRTISLHHTMVILAWISALGVLTSTVFSLIAIYAAARFNRNAFPGAAAEFLPPVSVLKPLHGSEPDLEKRLASFFEQDYPEFEILFCARQASDAGLQIARSTAARYPHVKARFLTCGQPSWPNARTFSLEVMRQAAANEILVAADSDVLVDPNYLRAVIAPFHDSKVGLVTCLYRGVTKHGLWPRLESLGMSVEMTSGVLVAEMLEGMLFALGPSMAMRKATIEKIGGYGAVAQYYADDFVLGNWTAKAGETVVLSRHVVEHHILNSSFRSSMAHQQGWATSTRFSRPSGHVGSLLTFAVPFGVLAFVTGLALDRPWIACGLLAVTVLNRVVLCLVMAILVVQDKKAVRNALLYPLRDLLGFWFWLASFFKNRLKYRGEPYQLLPEGRLRRLF